MKRLPNKVTLSAPKRIWLQLGDDPEVTRYSFSELEEVTWSDGQETRECIEYVRADLVPDLSAVITWLENGCDTKEAVKELRSLQKKLNSTTTNAAITKALNE